MLSDAPLASSKKWLCAGSSLRLNMHLSTGGLAHMELEIYWWQQVRWGCGELQLFVNPKRMPKG